MMLDRKLTVASLALVGLGACTSVETQPPAPEGAISSTPASSDSAGPTSPSPPVDPTAERTPVLHDAVVRVRVLHREHRAIPGVMFGGWGPHLGHLLRRRVAGKDTLYFADDACAPGACNVNVNQRIDYLRLGDDGWTRIDSLPLPAGIQQNTASILAGPTSNRFVSFGIDSGGQRLVECSRDADTGAKGCTVAAAAIGPAANYVGAAITPRGYRMAWFTNVKDAGGGSFSFFADYGAGWNGPRQGAVGGYNDSSYVNVAFGVDGDPDRFTMHSELVSGVAPAWSFVGAVGEGDVSRVAPVAWTTPLVGPPGDPVISPNDVLVDPTTGDTHLLGRTRKGATAYYFRPKGGAYQGPVAVLPSAGRARLVSLSDGALVLVRSDGSAGGIVVHAVARKAIVPGAPIAWPAAKVVRPTLPTGYSTIHAIYTESSAYSLAPRATLEIAVVGAARESEVIHVSIEGLSP